MGDRIKLTILTLILVATNTIAVTLNPKTDTTTETTGERIEGAFFDAVTTNVVEEMELHITARSDSATHQLNANSDGMGINNVSTSDDKPARFEVLNGVAEGINHDKRFRPRRQDRDSQYVENGAVYVMNVRGFLKEKHRFFGKTVISVMPQERSFEIDELIDLHIVEAMLKMR